MLNVINGYFKIIYKEDRGEILSHLIDKENSTSVSKHYYEENNTEYMGRCLWDGAKKTAEAGISLTAKCVSMTGNCMSRETVAKGIAIGSGVVAVATALPLTPFASAVGAVAAASAPLFAAANGVKMAGLFAVNCTLICGVTGFAARTVGRLTNPELMGSIESGSLGVKPVSKDEYNSEYDEFVFL